MVASDSCERRSVGIPDPDACTDAAGAAHKDAAKLALVDSSSISSMRQEDIKGCVCGDTCSMALMQQGLHEDFVNTNRYNIG